MLNVCSFCAAHRTQSASHSRGSVMVTGTVREERTSHRHNVVSTKVGPVSFYQEC